MATAQPSFNTTTSPQWWLLFFTEKINHLKINRARSRKTLRKTYLKVNRKTRAMCPRKTPAQDRHKKKSAIREATNKKSAIREGTKKKIGDPGRDENIFEGFFEVWLKWKFRSWRSILSKNRQNRSYPRVLLTTSKFRQDLYARPPRKTFTQDLHAKLRKTFCARPRPVNFFYKT